MTQLIEKIASIPMDASSLGHLDLDRIYRDFASNFKRLDDLKKFRTEYEKKNAFMRWWDNDQLRDAQLDSAEVQASFSKTLGQLVTISIIQAKDLTRHQVQLNAQQQQLHQQVREIDDHSKKIEANQINQNQQAIKLEQLVRDYIRVKGVSDENIKKLAEIVIELDNTKEEFFSETRKITTDATDGLRRLQSETSRKMGWLETQQHQLVSDVGAMSAGLEQAHQRLKGIHQDINDDLVRVQASLAELSTATESTVSALELRVSAHHQALTDDLQKMQQERLILEQKICIAEGVAKAGIEQIRQAQISTEEQTDARFHTSIRRMDDLTDKASSLDQELQKTSGSMAAIAAKADGIAQKLTLNLALSLIGLICGVSAIAVVLARG